jgi:cyclic pyranopterin phosphate synthase
MSARTRLTHVDAEGRIRMVDVGAKPVTERQATASGHVSMSAAARAAIRGGTLKKGNPLEAARLAGIMAAKRTAELIPLCHPLMLTGIDVEVAPTGRGVAIRATVRTAGQTGVEMEALTAVAGAALTVYDMVKAVDKAMVIDAVQLEEKRGGRSGHYRRLAGARARRR